MTRSLRPVGRDEKPVPAPPKDLVGAADGSRVELLKLLRRRIAGELDVGVPPHTLGRLASELARLDQEVRDLEARLEEDGVERVEDKAFDYGAV